MNKILVIDRGTTNIKVIVFDEKLTQISASIKKCHPVIYQEKIYATQDMDEIWNDTISAIRRVWQNGIRPEEIDVLSVTGQGSGLYLLDRQGRPAAPGITSLDKRCGCHISEWMEGKEERFLRLTGIELSPVSPLANLKWMQEFQPEVLDQTEYFFSAKDWIRFCLTGKVGSDYTEISAAGMMNCGGYHYQKSVFSLLGIEACAEKCPPLYQPWECAGYVTEEAALQSGLIAGTPVVAGAQDVACCSVGAGGIARDHATVVAGTIGLNLYTQNIPEGARHTAVFPQLWIAAQRAGSTGAVMDYMINLLFQKELNMSDGNNYAFLHKHLESRPSKILCHPYLFGDCPGRQNSTLCFSGIDNTMTKYEIFSGFCQGAALSHAYAFEKMLRGKKPKEIWIAGGCARISVFPAFLADILGVPVIRPKTMELTSRGAGMAAVCYLSGGIENMTDLRPEVEVCYEPRKEYVGQMKELYQRFVKKLEMMG